MRKQKSVKTAPRVAKRAPSTSQALARQAPRQQVELVIHDPRAMLPTPAASAVPLTLSDDVFMGDLGTVEVKLTPEEETVLSEKVLEAEVFVKPTSEGIVYLSWPTYTKWFNRAFGRTGWVLRAISKPTLTSGEVAVDYMLYVHRQPVAAAKGSQEYHESNAEQTYADAYEATRASALRRCAKQLGVGLELWDKRWCASFLARHCVQVYNEKTHKMIWRRKDDAPFWWETKPAKGSASGAREHVNTRTGEVTTSAPMSTERGEQLISDHPKGSRPDGRVGQVQRLQTIRTKSGRDVESVKAWLAVAYGYGSAKEIKQKHYDAICAAIQSPGPLPLPPAAEREPGED